MREKKPDAQTMGRQGRLGYGGQHGHITSVLAAVAAVLLSVRRK